MTEYPQVHTATGLREEAERCFRIARKASDRKLRDELFAYGKELIERAQRMEATAKAAAGAPGDPENQR